MKVIELMGSLGNGETLVLGTDYPYPWDDKTVDHIMNTPSLSDEERVAILGGTAAKLLGVN